MKPRLGKTLSTLQLTAAVIAISVSSATAGPILLAARVDNGGPPTDVCAVDNNAFVCTWGTQLFDENPAPNVLGVGSVVPINIGGLLVTSSIQVAVMSSGFNLLSSSSTTVTNSSSETLTANVAIGATDFIGPVNRASTTASGTWAVSNGSTINLEWYDDPQNTPGAQTPFDRPGTLVNSQTDTAVGALDSFAFTDGPFAVSDPALFGMTLAFDLTMTPGASLISRGMAEVKDLRQVAEPATLGLLGLGIAASCVRRRRR